MSLSRHAKRVEVVTEILLPAETDGRAVQDLLEADTTAVGVAASSDIEHEACEAAKRMVNVLIAERATSSRDRR